MTITTHCRSCGAGDLRPVLNLGSTPLANDLRTPEQLAEPQACYPLEVVFCPACSLVQITASVPPETLFREYVYFSSVSDTLLEHARRLAESLIRTRQLGPQSLVVEIASNDGYLLRNFHEAGVPVLGIEPARNIAHAAEQRGIPTLCEFFGARLAARLAAEGVTAHVILANNVMAHVPDINGVVDGIQRLLEPDGVFVMETPYVRNLIEDLEFDTIYHEHLFYYSLTALESLLGRHGLAAVDVERVPIHGGSLRVTVVHDGREGDRPAVRALLAEEAAAGLASYDYYRDFGRRVADLRTRLRGLLLGLRGQGHRLAAYGAAAKGSTLLHFMGVGPPLIEFVVDRSPHKQGRTMPGMPLPIYAPEKLLEAMPGYVLLLTWNFAEEIMAQQSEYRRRGGRFIIPLPEPKVV